MPIEQTQRLELSIGQRQDDKSYYICIVKDGKGFRLNGQYLCIESAKVDLEFLMSKMKNFRFEQKGV